MELNSKQRSVMDRETNYFNSAKYLCRRNMCAMNSSFMDHIGIRVVESMTLKQLLTLWGEAYPVWVRHWKKEVWKQGIF
jgi:hypothetical protein